jgi:hypothetical protein
MRLPLSVAQDYLWGCSKIEETLLKGSWKNRRQRLHEGEWEEKAAIPQAFLIWRYRALPVNM